MRTLLLQLKILRRGCFKFKLNLFIPRIMFPPVWFTLIFPFIVFVFNNAWKFESIECFLKVRFSSVRLWWCLNPKIPFGTPDLDRTKTWTDALTTPSEVSCWYRCPTGRSKNILSRVESYFQIYRTHICTEICHPMLKDALYLWRVQIQMWIGSEHFVNFALLGPSQISQQT